MGKCRKNINNHYILKKMKKIKNFYKKLILVAVIPFLLSCSKSKGGPADDPIVTPPPAEQSLQKELPFPFGAAISAGLLKTNSLYSGVVTKEFNSITTENSMKMFFIHPEQNTYNWTDADYLVDYAVKNGKRVHGHTLNWYKNPPAWVTNFQGDTQAWEALLKMHIQTVVSRYKGKVKSWDVVNEAIDDNGALRNSIWVQKLGEDYIARCFQYAHEADPDALLFYNDYGHEYGPTKRKAILSLVTGLKNRGIPIHGIGLQMHTRYTRSDADLTTAIQTAAATGLKVHISELDVAMNPENNQNLAFSASLAQLQSAKYKHIIKTYNAIPKNQQFGITTWNVSDADSWVPSFNNRPDWPLPFDKDYKRKAAYDGILAGVK